MAENECFVAGAGVNGLPPLQQGEGGIPVRHGELGVQGVADVGIELDGIGPGNAGTLPGQRIARLGTEEHAGQPGRASSQQAVEGFIVRLVETLGRHPQLGPGVIPP
ncbi:hypothetical protein AZA_51312 [Nitrospirillum viridazoti Y2]|nr:hypothetical protein AZA_51312 [Nitrospirillum amazonense Y2]